MSETAIVTDRVTHGSVCVDQSNADDSIRCYHPEGACHHTLREYANLYDELEKLEHRGLLIWFQRMSDHVWIRKADKVTWQQLETEHDLLGIIQRGLVGRAS